MSSRPISISFSEDQALVLLDWVKRFNEREDEGFEDQAEERVLWDIEAMLERSLQQPLHADYGRLLDEARARVRDTE